MSNIEKYKQAFVESFSLSSDVNVQELAYQSIAEWDSVGHMGLIANLEEVFDIMMDMEDIIDFGSYEIGIDILKKYQVDL